ncbi:putative LLM family oxidoreductase [Leifsonia sp. AK011]|uniref:LLM class flavin-dependent oxidoreductase n=1 Tax=Leifsonia sp. AK011 TaxID=2723075 RepID=UPI0015CC2012|nr:LLM class flavin-dependent oxidoreductase [Leifsonia sp. AK011]NYF09221.1 putative LLM family oxidoreductase [Leifsonia sp. AK011]
MRNIEFGLDTFAYATDDGRGGEVAGDQVIRNLIEEAVLAEEVGIDSFNIGEHYRKDLMDTASPVILASIASRTTRLRVGTAVTVLSTQDPVRVFHNFSTLDAVSDGRAQLIVGRGSASESFPLFGYDLSDYEELFEEKLELFTRLLREKQVTWSGKYRPPLNNEVVNPPLPSGHLPTWVAVGGSPQSVVRAARYGLPLMLAIIGGHPTRFRPYVDLFHRTTAEFGHGRQKVGIHSPGLIAETDQAAIDLQWPYWRALFEQEARIRGWQVPSKDHYLAEVQGGSLYVGSPDTIAPRIANAIRGLGADRFDLAYASGHVPHEVRMRNIELFGREVIPQVRELLAQNTTEVTA